MSWAAWVLVICAVVALICVAYGVVRAAVAGRKLKAHANRLAALPMLADAAEAQLYAQRINDDLAQIDGLLARAKIAVEQINEALAQLRIPEAVAAIRTAGAAIRLLFNGR